MYVLNTYMRILGMGCDNPRPNLAPTTRRPVENYGRGSMPRYRYAHSSPTDHLAHGQRWPNGRLKTGAPLEAVHAQQVGKRLHYHMQGRTNKEVAAIAGVTENALGRLMRGKTWGSLPIIVRLERALNADLWCDRPHTDET